MLTRILALALPLSLAFMLAGCANGSGDPSGTESRLAPGLYDLENDTVQAVGTLRRVDLEGGFWAVVESPDAPGNTGGNIAVIANGNELESVLTPLEGRTVSVVGERFDGVSIRMAGPEIVAETVEPIDDTPGAAE